MSRIVVRSLTFIKPNRHIIIVILCVNMTPNHKKGQILYEGSLNRTTYHITRQCRSVPRENEHACTGKKIILLCVNMTPNEKKSSSL